MLALSLRYSVLAREQEIRDERQSRERSGFLGTRQGAGDGSSELGDWPVSPKCNPLWY